jgi:hypothetical protein
MECFAISSTWATCWLSDLPAEDGSERCIVVQQAIKVGWSFVNRYLEDNPEEEESTTFQQFMTLVRAVDNDKAAEVGEQGPGTLMAIVASCRV